MINIFSEVSAIEEIFVSDKYPNWQKVLGNQTSIYLNIDEVELKNHLECEEGEESLLFLWYHENDSAKIPVALGAQFQFVDNEDSLIEQPFGLFILDIDEEKANELSSKYGIQIYSSKKIADFKDFEIDFDFEKDELVRCPSEILKGYDYVLEAFKSEKSNGSIIIDRNLFSNEEHGHNIGISNMNRFFNCILPETLETNYDILFVTHNTGKIENERFRKHLVTELTDAINHLREYNIDIEVLFIHSSTTIFEYTHQRRILNNYHFGNSEHGFAIFCAKNFDKVRHDNDFNIQSHYHSLFKEHHDSNSIKKRNKIYKRLLEIKEEAENKLKTQGQNDRYYRLYCNGSESFEIKNRLLN